jgi:hypothetical protein
LTSLHLLNKAAGSVLSAALTAHEPARPSTRLRCVCSRPAAAALQPSSATPAAGSACPSTAACASWPASHSQSFAESFDFSAFSPEAPLCTTKANRFEGFSADSPFKLTSSFLSFADFALLSALILSSPARAQQFRSNDDCKLNSIAAGFWLAL